MAHPTKKIDINSTLSHGGTLEGLDYLLSLTKWTGKGCFSPHSIKKVLSYLGNPQDKVQSVHVGGTNGKGSVSAMVASILGNEGYSVGLATSPHLVKMNERVVINGKAITDENLSYFSTILKRIEAKKGIRLTFHEAVTAVGFIAFHESLLDWMVIEVGLGGRLDSTNVMAFPEAIAITSIGFDHEEQLGSTLASITTEKCGILRPNVPIVTGNLPVEAMDVLNLKSKELGCDVFAYEESFHCGFVKEERAKFRSGELEIELSPSLKGTYQLENIGISCEIGKLLGVSIKSIEHGISNVNWPARFEKIENAERVFILDSAHNIDGVRALVDTLKHNNINKLDLIFSSLSTKNWQGMLELLLPFVRNLYFLKAHSESSISFKDLNSFLSCSGINSINYELDYSRLIQDISADIPILAAGSMYMVGGLRELLKVNEDTLIWTRVSPDER